MRFALSKDTIMKEPISSYEDYCRVWAEVYKKHARYASGNLFSCYVRQGIIKALHNGTKYPRPCKEVTTDEDLVGVYIVRALVAQGMDDFDIEHHTGTMQEYVDEVERLDIDPTDCMRSGLHKLGVPTRGSGERIEREGNRLRYLWALHGGFNLGEAAD